MQSCTVIPTSVESVKFGPNWKCHLCRLWIKHRDLTAWVLSKPSQSHQTSWFPEKFGALRAWAMMLCYIYIYICSYTIYNMYNYILYIYIYRPAVWFRRCSWYSRQGTGLGLTFGCSPLEALVFSSAKFGITFLWSACFARWLRGANEMRRSILLKEKSPYKLAVCLYKNERGKWRRKTVKKWS